MLFEKNAYKIEIEISLKNNKQHFRIVKNRKTDINTSALRKTCVIICRPVQVIFTQPSRLIDLAGHITRRA